MYRIASIALLFAAPVLAQDEMAAPPPAKELSKFAPMLGSWQGSGKAWQTADAEASEWTGSIRFEKVLGGHFIRETGSIDVGMPSKMLFKSFLGWDAGKKRYVGYGVDNSGSIHDSQISWDGDKLVQVASRKIDGKTVVDRWVTTFGDDSYSVRCSRAEGAGKFYTHVEGKFERKAPTRGGAATANAAFMDAKPAPEVGRFGKLTGTYDVAGWVAMGPMPKMDISGTETMTPLFGGLLLERKVKAQPGDYESWGVMGWCPERNCYVSIGLSNHGEGHLVEGHLVGNDLVFTASAMIMGQPAAMRSIMHCDDNGKLTKIVNHMISATGEPQKSFEGTYTKK